MKRNCEVCGSSFEAGTKGRPASFCGPDCRAVGTALTTLRSRLGAVKGRCTDSAWKDLRATLWRMSNQRGVNDRTGRGAA